MSNLEALEELSPEDQALVLSYAADLAALGEVTHELPTPHREVRVDRVEDVLYGGSRVKRTESKRVALWLMTRLVAPQAAKGWRSHMLGTRWISDRFDIDARTVTNAKRILTDKGILRVWKHAEKSTGTPARYVVCYDFLY